jgi:hypothetical protein
MFFNRSKKRSTVLSILLAFLVCFFPMTLTLPTNVQAATTLTTYPAPSGVTLDTTFTVQVRVPGGAWQNLDEYQTRIGAPTRATYASFVYFDTDGPVDLSVTLNSGTVTSASVKPNNLGITPAINGNTMTFSISGPQKLVFDVNGNVDNDLMIFANPVEVNPPSPTDPDVIYLGPGIYNQDFTVPSGKTLYIAGGAVVRGGVILNNTMNTKVIGRGVLDHPAFGGVEAMFANNLTIDGIIVNVYNNANSGGNGVLVGSSTNVTINNIKLLAFQRWSDGIDTYNVNNVTINDVFVRTGDDSISVYGSRGVWSGNSTNISVTNSILMPGKAHPINIGTHGNPGAAGGGDNIDTLNFSNLDILTYNPLSAGFPLQMSFTASDGSLITDANFSDIRIDDAVVNKFLDIKTFKNPGYGLGVGRGINNVYFKNISYTGANSNTNDIFGNSSTRLTQNVTFENLTVNGTPVLSASAGNFAIGNYANNINFIASGATPPSTLPIPHYVPINVALKRTASADSSQAGNPAASGNDGNETTRWSANDGNTGHSWTVDLGSSMEITRGTQVKWQLGGGGYQYKIETSNDNTNWKLKVDKTSNTSTDQVQSDVFYDSARYVRITVTGLPSGANASFYEFNVFGDQANLALNKTASSDSSQTSNPASFGVDGNAATRWIANDGNTGHSLTVNLGSSRNITNGTQVAWEKSGVYQYKIETSTDNTNWTTVIDKTANTSTDQVQNDYFTGIAHYVRITVTGLPSGSNASFYDLKVFGDPTDLALNKTASSDSSQTTNPASNGNDGNTATSWVANDGLTGHWWLVDLGTSKTITGGVQLKWEQLSSIYSYKIETSTDNTNWTTVIDRTNNFKNAQVYNNFFTGTARYVRVTATGLSSGINAGISDFKIFGDTGETVPVAQLPFDETSGTTANDATGNGWNGTLVGGASFVAGNSGNAVDLDGTNGYVSLPTGVVSNASTATVSAWVYLDSTSNYSRIFDFGSGTSTNMFLTPKNSSGKIRFAIKLNDSSEQRIDGQAALPTGGWHHVAVTLNGSTGTLYVDGAQVGINTAMTLKPSDMGATTKNWIGHSQYSADPYLDGRVDDFRIYNRALTASEVTHLKNGQSVFPIAELPFDTTSGTTATDVSGNGWDGRLANGATWVAGHSGNAVSLNGSNQYVDLPAGVVSSADTMTITAWVNLNTVTNWTRIFDFGTGTTNYMFLTPKNGTTIRFAIKSASSTEQVIDGTAALPTGGWHHVAVTLNGSTGTLYVDGVQVGTNTAMTITPNMLGATTQNWIGRSQFSSDPYLNGLVDNFRIYNRALSASEVLAVMNE